MRRRRPALRGPEEGPDDPARFHRRIGPSAYLVREAQLLRLIQHVHAAAVDVELPAVVDAAQSAVFVPPQEERGLPVRAALTPGARGSSTAALPRPWGCPGRRG